MKILTVKSSLGGLDKKGGEKGVDLVVKGLEVSDVKVDSSNIEETNKNIFEAVSGFKGLIVGGDHSITYPAFSAFSARFKNPGLIIFDAHPDCVNNFKPPSHEDFVRVLVSEGKVKAENVILVGVRKMHKNESDFIKEKKIKVFIELSGEVIDIARGFDGLYVSIDIDVVDPSFAPGTGYCERGGLLPSDLISFVRKLKKLDNLKIVDLVEINPEKDINMKTVKLGTKIVKELVED